VWPYWCCCDICPAYIKFEGCPPEGECDTAAPEVYVNSALRCQDDTTLWNKTISLPQHPDLSGWCWTNSDPCSYHCEPGPPPQGRCELPIDAILIDPPETVLCVDGCADAVCVRRGDFIIPSICASPCGTDRPILVCPDQGLDTSKCHWVRLPNDADCGCIVIGPHSRAFSGDSTGYVIVDGSAPWNEASNPEAACCECCWGCPNGCLYEEVRTGQMEYPFCYKNPNNLDTVPCCCGDHWLVASVQRRYRRNLSVGGQSNYLNEFSQRGWSLVVSEWDADDGFVQCRHAQGRVLQIQRFGDLDDGDPTEERREWNVNGCDDPDITIRFEDSYDGCGRGAFELAGGTSPLCYHRSGGNPFNSWASDWADTYEGYGCSGTASLLDCAEQNCVGSFNLQGACHQVRLFGKYATDYIDLSGNRLAFNTEWTALTITVITNQHAGCEGGCPRKWPKIGALFGNRVDPIGATRIGAGDLL
jgi:hypothetical protein